MCAATANPNPNPKLPDEIKKDYGGNQKASRSQYYHLNLPEIYSPTSSAFQHLFENSIVTPVVDSLKMFQINYLTTQRENFIVFTYPASRKMHGKARLLRSNFSNLIIEFHLTVSKFSSKMESRWKCVVTMNKQQLDVTAVMISDVNIKWSTINRICIFNWLSSIRRFVRLM